MPKKKKLYVDYPDFLLHETLDHCMFAYILGLQRGLPTVTLHRSMELFMEDFNLNEDIFPLEFGKATWYRMHPKYVKLREELDK